MQTGMNTGVTEREVILPAGPVSLSGTLAVPAGTAGRAAPGGGARGQGGGAAAARGLVLFAHGSGSSRHSPRNRYVAGVLNSAGLATLLFDLLTAEEEAIDQHTRELRFDVALLAERLVGATDWAGEAAETGDVPVGYFGASTGAGAALVAAAERPEVVRAIVSRGGRPDLARTALAQVRAPTLLIVGGEDAPVIGMNEAALAQLSCQKALEIVPGATHLFEEPGALEAVARLARDWFLRHLQTAVSQPA